ncbi:hypothetical protein [Kitasatospora sp. NPDC057015]|uniref:hypothetical protein n=1 Tax=Kitasatospora sp. NPDC057015 TaxID=3346001 RepID=UPI00363686DF
MSGALIERETLIAAPLEPVRSSVAESGPRVAEEVTTAGTVAGEGESKVASKSGYVFDPLRARVEEPSV